MKYSYIIILILVAINIKLRIPANPEIDMALLPYVKTFKQLCKTYQEDCSKVDKFKIKLKDMSRYDILYKALNIQGKVIGHCFENSNEIDIRKEHYEMSTPAEMELLMIHELGHCILGLEHTEDEPAIMNSYTVEGNFYVHNYNELINKFFRCVDNCPIVKFDINQY